LLSTMRALDYYALHTKIWFPKGIVGSNPTLGVILLAYDVHRPIEESDKPTRFIYLIKFVTNKLSTLERYQMIQQNKILLFDKNLKAKAGSHIVLLYQDESELIDALSDYFSEGITNNNSCAMACQNDNLQDKIIKQIESKKILTRKQIQEKIVFINTKKFYYSKKKFNANSTYKKIDESIAKDRLCGLRAAGDMRWVNNNNFNDVHQYEIELSSRYNTENVLFICAYSLKDISTFQLIKIIQSHSLILFKENGKWELSHPIEKDISEHKIDDLERFTKHAVDRELRMIELKEKITKLESELEKYNKNSQQIISS